MVSSREVSAAVCMARLRSAMNFVGRRALVVAVASIMSDVTGSSGGVDASSAVDCQQRSIPRPGLRRRGLGARGSAVSDAMGSA